MVHLAGWPVAVLLDEQCSPTFSVLICGLVSALPFFGFLRMILMVTSLPVKHTRTQRAYNSA